MEYRDRGEGEHGAPTRRAADPPDRRHGHTPPDPYGGGGGRRVPGPRAHGYDDDDISHPYVSPSDPGGRDRGPLGRHRQPDPRGEAPTEPRLPESWHAAEGRWRPTLDPTDWRYATDDVGYPYGPAVWEDDRSGADRGSAPHADRYGGGGYYADEWDAPRSGRPQMNDATEVLGEPIRDEGNSGPPARPPSGWDADPGHWERPTQHGPWSPDVTGHWELSSDTGQWERFADAEWPGGQPAGPESAESGGRPDPPYGQDRPDGFWAGIRLAGDDPRWTTTPTSAPHSPAVFLPHDAAAPPTAPPTAAAPGARPARHPEPDHPAPHTSSSMVAAVLFTVAWYVVPALVLLVWILTMDGSPPQDCAIDAAQRCESARAQAAAAVVDSGPRAAAALGVSLVIAVLLRWSSSWRAASVGLAAAVIGGGLATLLISVITGQPLG